MNLIIDTGSSNTAVISDHCVGENCTFVQKPYLAVPSRALIDKAVASYGNNKTRASWEGYAVGQTFQLSDGIEVFSRVDVITRNYGFFHPSCPQNQGLWGLAYPGLQTKPNKTHLNQDWQHTLSSYTLLDAARYAYNIPNGFAYQLCPKKMVDESAAQGFKLITNNSDTKVTDDGLQQQYDLLPFQRNTCRRAGHFYIGGYDNRTLASEITYVPIKSSRKNPHYYEVQIDHFVVNGHVVQHMQHLNRPRTIIDTGTRDIVLSSHNLEKLLEALWRAKVIRFGNAVSPEHERSFWMDHYQLTIPGNIAILDTNTTVAVSISGKSIAIPLENLLRVIPVGNGWVNISWTGLSASKGTQVAATVLGNTFLRGKTTLWDRAQGRIGFADIDSNMCCMDATEKNVTNYFAVTHDEPPFEPILAVDAYNAMAAISISRLVLASTCTSLIFGYVLVTYTLQKRTSAAETLSSAQKVQS